MAAHRECGNLPAPPLLFIIRGLPGLALHYSAGISADLPMIVYKKLPRFFVHSIILLLPGPLL
jgi:hypothetical protein